MCSKEEFLNTKLPANEFPNINTEDLTTYEFLSKKYNNFCAFVAELATFHPEIIKFSRLINILPIEEFREMLIPKLINALVFHIDHDVLRRNQECERVILQFCLDNGIDVDKIRVSPNNKGKLIRYCILFTILLSDP